MGVVENIRAYCEENDMTISEFQRKCGLSPSIVFKWKSGAVKPTIRLLEKVAAHTGIPVSKWLEDRVA